MSDVVSSLADRQSQRTHWSGVANKFKDLGSPLRPSQEDINEMERVVVQSIAHPAQQQSKALLWGVTPEIATLAWPVGTYLLAIDQSEEMARTFWPGDICDTRKVKLGNWLDLSVADGSCDVVIGDGCFSCVPYPDGYRALAASAHRVLTAQGKLIMRFFVQPDEPEAYEDVFEDLMAGKIGSFHAFKWRLVMAVQSSSHPGVPVSEVWRVWTAAGIDRERLSAATGWPIAAINTIDYYKYSTVQLTFPTVRQVQQTLCERFEETSLYFPSYELGERCPIIALRPRNIGRYRRRSL